MKKSLLLLGSLILFATSAFGMDRHWIGRYNSTDNGFDNCSIVINDNVNGQKSDIVEFHCHKSGEININSGIYGARQINSDTLQIFSHGRLAGTIKRNGDVISMKPDFPVMAKDTNFSITDGKLLFNVGKPKKLTRSELERVGRLFNNMKFKKLKN